MFKRKGKDINLKSALTGYLMDFKSSNKFKMPQHKVFDLGIQLNRVENPTKLAMRSTEWNSH